MRGRDARRAAASRTVDRRGWRKSRLRSSFEGRASIGTIRSRLTLHIGSCPGRDADDALARQRRRTGPGTRVGPAAPRSGFDVVRSGRAIGQTAYRRSAQGGAASRRAPVNAFVARRTDAERKAAVIAPPARPMSRTDARRSSRALPDLRCKRRRAAPRVDSAGTTSQPIACTARSVAPSAHEASGASASVSWQSPGLNGHTSQSREDAERNSVAPRNVLASIRSASTTRAVSVSRRSVQLDSARSRRSLETRN